MAEFNLAYRPDLNIVDATVAMIEGGPWKGTPARNGIIIASGDRVAADAVGLGLIRSFGRWRPVTGKGNLAAAADQARPSSWSWEGEGRDRSAGR